jgi:hypothetical protein
MYFEPSDARVAFEERVNVCLLDVLPFKLAGFGLDELGLELDLEKTAEEEGEDVFHTLKVVISNFCLKLFKHLTTNDEKTIYFFINFCLLFLIESADNHL